MAQIILIEPDRVLAATYRQGLEASGHRVVMCASAQAAIYAADEIWPDVIITELQLIGHSGIEFLYEFRSYSEWQTIPVLIHSHVPPAEFSDAWELLRNELGISHYLYKPLTSFKQLLRVVNDCLVPASAPVQP
ncbi:MAG: response regulator [Patescibacteria group bacterium]|nr:response regulator [Patescibacteria group bacterium]